MSDAEERNTSGGPRPRRRLGGTDIPVTPIGLGTWQFSEGRGGAMGMWSTVPPEERDAIVRASLGGGVNWFETAELYGFGRSETGLAHALERAGAQDGSVVIATKWNPLLRTAASIPKTIGRRLEHLRPFGIDLHQVHFPASFSSVEREMHAMADLIEAGVIRAAGVSNYSARQMRRAHETLVKRGFVLASNQVKYSILDRRIETNGILSTARELGITVIAYSPLEMGLLTGKFHQDPSALESRPLMRRLRLRRWVEKSRPLIEVMSGIAREHDVSVSQVALGCLVNFHGETVVAISGASKAKHAAESAHSMELTLTLDEMSRIRDRASAL